jgi:hypothetical protein
MPDCTQQQQQQQQKGRVQGWVGHTLQQQGRRDTGSVPWTLQGVPAMFNAVL